VVKRVLVIATVVLVSVVGCSDGGGAESTQPSDSAAETTETFSSDGVEFTFSIAEGGTQVDGSDEVLAAVLLDPADADNGVKIRQAASEPLPSGSYIETIRQQFEADLGVDVEFTNETHADIEMAVLSYEAKRGSIDESVSNYFFEGNTATWHIECISTKQSTREAVDDLCDEALDTLALE
jgi:maltose-binding protein MalE